MATLTVAIPIIRQETISMCNEYRDIQITLVLTWDEITATLYKSPFFQQFSYRRPLLQPIALIVSEIPKTSLCLTHCIS